MRTTQNQCLSTNRTYLGNGEKVLGNVDDTGHLLDVLNAGLDGLGVVRPGAVEDVLDLLVLSLSPGLVAGATVLDDSTPDGEQADGDDGLLVHDVVLVAQGVDAEGGAGAEDGGLAEQAVAGEGVNDALGLLLGLLGGDIARVADGSGGNGREGTAGDGRSEEGSAYKGRRQQKCQVSVSVAGAANWVPRVVGWVIQRTGSAAHQS